MTPRAHRVGAAFYVLWGIVHVLGGFAILTAADVPAKMAMQATALAPDSFTGADDAALGAVLSYHGFDLVWIGLFAIILGGGLTWRNSLFGYWLNTAVIGAVELGLVVFLLAPGYMRVTDGGIGLGLFALAWFFSTVGVRQGLNRGGAVRTSPIEGKAV